MRLHMAIVAAFVVLTAGSGGGLIAQDASSSANDTFSPDLFGGLEYRMVGPSRGGRVTAVAGHRDQPSTFYMGAAGGGVWKTTDYGQSWHNISDGYFATGSIGAIRVAESDPNIIYVATGSDGLRSNVIIGKGVYKSTDAGETWTHVGLEKTGNSGAVLIHPPKSGSGVCGRHRESVRVESGARHLPDEGRWRILGPGAVRVGADRCRGPGVRTGQP